MARRKIGRLKLFKKGQKIVKAFRKKHIAYLKKRPHRSFHLTRRRDYKRSLSLPGYWSFTNEVRSILWRNKWLFIKFIAIYCVLIAVTAGIMSQLSYQTLNDTIHRIGTDVLQGQVGGFGQNIAIFAGVIAGTFNEPLSPDKQVYAGLIFILGWLTLVWLLRQILAGHKNIRLRDGVYSSGAPLVPTFLVFMVLLIQFLPFAFAAIGYIAADSVDVLGDPLLTTLFWLVELLLMTLSLFWITSSFVALVVVTLPGMYPLRALKASGDLVTGRRLRILYRIGWLFLTLILLWVIVLLPVIGIADLIHIAWLPIVPVAVLIVSTTSVVWGAAYIYLLYRKLVDDDASPA